LPRASSGKSEQITITNDKSRLTQEQIEKMIKEGEKFAEEDALHKKRTETLNSVSSFVYGLKTQLADKDGMGGKLSSGDKAQLQEIIKEGSEWIDEHSAEASLEELEEKLAGAFLFVYFYEVFLILCFSCRPPKRCQPHHQQAVRLSVIAG
jgi:heat shock protein 5